MLFSCSVMPNSLRPHGLQHARLPCPSPSPRACSNSCLLSQWCHPTISSSFAPPSPPTFNLSQQQGFFLMTQLLTSGSQSIRASASASVLPMNIQDWFPSGSPCSPRDTQESSPTSQLKKINSSMLSLLMVQLSHPYMTTGKAIALTRQTFVSKVMSLLFNTLSRFVIGFLPGSKRLLISWLQLPFAVILEPQNIKSVTASIVSPAICHEGMGLDLSFLNVEF